MHLLERWSGALALGLFTVATAIGGALQPEYSHVDLLISDLGAPGRTAPWVLNLGGFLPAGALILLLARALWSWLEALGASRAIAWLVGLHGGGMLLAAFFSCDLSYRCNPPSPSTGQMIHNLLALVKFPALLLAMWIAAMQLRRRAAGFARLSLLLAPLATLLFFAFGAAVTDAWGAGLYQRGFIAVMYVWLALAGLSIERGSARVTPAREECGALPAKPKDPG